MKKLRNQIAVGLVCIVLGLMIAFQFKVSNNPQEKYRSKQFSELVNDIENLKKTNSELSQKLQDAQNKYEGVVQSTAGENKLVENMKKEIDDLRIVSGMKDVKASGVIITINMPKEIQINNPDIDYLSNMETCLWEIVNDLNSIGAEAISINGERYISRTQIRVADSSIKINDSKFSPFGSFVIKAIGNPKLIDGAFKMPDSSVDYYRSLGFDITINQSDKVIILKYNKPLNYKYIKRK